MTALATAPATVGPPPPVPAAAPGRHRRHAPIGLGRPGRALGAGPEHGVYARTLQVAAVLTVGLAPVEGYLLEYGTTLTKAPAAMLVVGWLWVRMHGRRLPTFHPVHVPMAVLAVAVLASSAVHNGDTFTIEYAIRWVSFLVAAFVLLDVAGREVPVRYLLGAAIAGALVAAGGAVHSFAALGDLRATGPMEDPNDLAYVIVAALPLLVAMAGRRTRHGRPRRWVGPVLAVAALVLVTGAAVTVSRGGAVALTIAVAWLVWRRAVSRRTMLAVAGVVAAGVVAVAVAFGPLVSAALSQKQVIGESNVDTRALRWQIAARMLPDHPLLGVGPGGFRSNYMGYSHNAELLEQTPVAHNMYIEVAAELGLLGFAGFAAMIVVALLAAERAIRAGPDRTLPLAVQAGLIAVLVASTFLSEQYYMPLWSMTAAACALDLRSRTEDRR